MVNSKALFAIRKSRSSNGFSLVSVLVTAAITAMFLAASSAGIIPLFRSIGQNSSDVLLTTAAESATDFTVGLLNHPASRAEVDCGSEYGSVKRVNDNVPLLPAMFGLPEGASVEVKVRNIAPSPSATNGTSRSLSFDPLLSPYGDSNLPSELKNFGERWGYLHGSGKNQWRVIECRVKLGAYEKLILSTLKPSLEAKPLSERGGSTALFSSQGGTGLSSIGIGVGSTTSGYDSIGTFSDNVFQDAAIIDQNTNALARYGGDVASFGRVSLSNNSSVGGLAQILLDGTGAVTSGQAKNIDGTGIITQQIKSANPTDGFVFDPAGDPASNTVLNAGTTDSGIFPKVISPSQPTDVLNVSPDPGQPIAPAPSAPSSTQFSTELQYSGSSSMSGDYATDSFGLSSGGSVTVATADTVRVFVEPSSGGDAPVVINGNVNASNDQNPANFQIFYNGTGTIAIQGSGNQFVNATIYAPNANVIMGGSSGHLTFRGAITARNIAGAYDSFGNPISGVAQTDMIFDFNLRRAGQQNNPDNNSKTALQSLSYNPQDILSGTVLKVVSVLEPMNSKDMKYSH